MLDDRGTGWADWELSNFHNRISYIDDFPFNMTEALINYLETGQDQEVEFDGEGFIYSFKISSNVVAGKTEIYENSLDFANDFVEELEKSLESWSHFPVRRTKDEDYKELANNIAKIRMQLMDENLLDKWMEIIS